MFDILLLVRSGLIERGHMVVSYFGQDFPLLVVPNQRVK